jgi:transcriptional regulator GlxA family with amidase domain
VSVFAPSPVALARLRSVHERMGRMAETAPELLTNTDLASDLESDLMSAVHDLRRVDASTSTDTVAKRHHQIIVNRFYDVLEAQVETPLQMPAISQIIGVSSRTLRLACQEQLGVSPARYVMLRRMHSARRALRNAGPDVTCVTDIAMEYGFWELGRFAVNYRHFFGESPSATLRAAA